MSPERVFIGEEGEIHPCRWTKDRKGVGTSCGESGETNLEAESIRSREESTGGCGKLKTVWCLVELLINKLVLERKTVDESMGEFRRAFSDIWL